MVCQNPRTHCSDMASRGEDGLSISQQRAKIHRNFASLTEWNRQAGNMWHLQARTAWVHVSNEPRANVNVKQGTCGWCPLSPHAKEYQTEHLHYCWFAVHCWFLLFSKKKKKENQAQKTKKEKQARANTGESGSHSKCSSNRNFRVSNENPSWFELVEI